MDFFGGIWLFETPEENFKGSADHGVFRPKLMLLVSVQLDIIPR